MVGRGRRGAGQPWPAEMSVGRDVMRGMETFTLVPRGPFSLAASIRFLEGFTPAWYSSAPDGVLELAFPAEGSWRTVGVRVSQAGEKVEAGIVSPAEPGADLVAEVRPQVERILSLDVDGSGFPAVGERDPVAGEVQRRYPGLRPVGFWSPYEAAAWTIIGHRIRITQAGGPEEAARDRGLLRRAHPAARRERSGRRAQRGAAAGPRDRARLRTARPGHARADPSDQRELAAIPDLGHPAAANPAGVRDGRDHRQARSRPDGLSWGQHVVASRVPPAVRQVLHN